MLLESELNNTATATASTQAAANPNIQNTIESPEPKSSQQDDQMRSKFAALARKERMARFAQNKLKEKEASLAERERMLSQRESQWENEFKTTPLEALKRRNLTYEDLTKAALNDGKFEPATEIKSVKEEIERLRMEQKEKEKMFQEEREQEQAAIEEQAVRGFKNKISQTIEANKEKFELISFFDASELVYDTVEEFFNRSNSNGNPKILSIDEACDLVEQYLENEIDRVSKASKKFQSKFASQKSEPQEKTPFKTTTTLSNDFHSSAPSLLPAHTENDRMKRALAKLG